MKKMKLEICVDSYASLQNALINGADRVELCSALSLGGLSPSYGTLLMAADSHRDRVFVMVRPRAGDFLYTDAEFAVMLEEVKAAKRLGFPGIVVGMLTPEGNVDISRLARLIAEARPMSVTFHRAFDNGANPQKMIEDLISVGVDRLLTSGQEQDAIKGATLIRTLQQKYGTKICIMPGSGINSHNLDSLIELTGCEEYHLSAKTFLPSMMHLKKPVLPIPDDPSWYNDGDEIRNAKRILRDKERTIGNTGEEKEEDETESGSQSISLSSHDPNSKTAPNSKKQVTRRHKHIPRYDPDFLPMIELVREYKEILSRASEKAVTTFSILRNHIPFEDIDIEITNCEEMRQITLLYVERTIKTHLWIIGGDGIAIDGPEYLLEYIGSRYRENGPRQFDVNFFAEVFGRKFEVMQLETKRRYPKKTIRIGLDLGGSTLKLTVLDMLDASTGVDAGEGRILYQTEDIWTPKTESHPDYHYKKIVAAIESALVATKKDKSEIAFIGYSAAGIVLENRIVASSLFRRIPSSLMEERLELFEKISRTFGGIPYRIVNDGEISALAGKEKKKKHSVLGLTLGTSLGCGYMPTCGGRTEHINELAFVPLDFSPSAVLDEWSGDAGVGVSYLSQDAVIKLAHRAGLTPQGHTPSEQFRAIAHLAEREERAIDVFKDIGIYLAYAIAYYREFFVFDSLLLLGGVVAGKHGKIILDCAKNVLSEEFPDIYAQLEWISTDYDAHLQDRVAARLEAQ